MAKKLNSKIEERDIVDIYRNKMSGKIVVKFNHIQNKNEFIQQCKRKKLKSGDVINTNNKNDDNKHIFVNDELTHHNRKLFWTTKNTAKEKGWKFIWIRNGKILARKNENEKVLSINKEQDLCQII